jgi:hypothetical protein
MAQVSFIQLASGTFAPNQKVHWIWNNAPMQRVWAFTCEITAIDGYWSKGEITKTWQTDSGGQGRQLHVEAMNSGYFTEYYTIYMAMISP